MAKLNPNRLLKRIRIDESFLLVFLISFLVYVLTCARHLTWEHDGADGGDFAACAYTLGIPHPTGYPLYCLLGWLFIRILPIGEVAFRMTLFSALFAALGAGFCTLAIRHASDYILPDGNKRLRHFWMPVIAGFTIAFSYTYWSQALIVEVYSLNAFFLSIITLQIALFIKHEDQKSREKIFLFTAFIAGLGFTNHLATLYPLLAGIIAIAFTGWVPSFKTFFKGLGFFFLPLLLYLYLPIRARMNPVMNWGDPEDLRGFLWVLTGKQFKRLVFNSLTSQILYRVFHQINLLKQFGWLGLAASFTGIASILWNPERKTVQFFIFLTGVIILNFVHIANYLVIDPLSFMLPAFMMLGIFASIGIGYLLNEAAKFEKRILDSRMIPSTALVKIGALAFAFLIPVTSFFLHYQKEDISKNNETYDYVNRVIDNAEPGGIICEYYYGRSLSLLYYHYAEGYGKDKNLTPLYFEQMIYSWGKKNFREQYPDLEITPDDYIDDEDEIAQDFIKRNYNRVPAIYFSRSFAAPEGYDWEVVDDLYKAVRKEE